MIRVGVLGILISLLFGCDQGYIKQAQYYVDNNDYQKAYDLLLEHRDENLEPEVLFSISVWQLNGLIDNNMDIITSNNQAVSWLKEAADQGDKKSLNLLIEIYQRGEIEGVIQSNQVAECLASIEVNSINKVSSCTNQSGRP